MPQNTNREEQNDIRKQWGIGLTLAEARGAEQRLFDVLGEATRNGADQETIKSIYNVWDHYKEKVNEMEKALMPDGEPERPDIMQDYAMKSRENVEKGMHLLSDQVDGINRQAKKGELTDEALITGKVIESHETVHTVYHEKQSELAEQLSQSFEKVKEGVADLIDQARLDQWVYAVDIADKFDRELPEKLEKIEKAREENIEKIAGAKQEGLEQNQINYQKRLEEIEKGIPSRLERIQASIKQIGDSILGKEHVNYLSEEHIAANKDKSLAGAERKLKFDNTVTELSSQAKLGLVKAWSTAQSFFHKGVAKVSERHAEGTQKGVENIKDEKIKNLQEKIASYAKEHHIGLKEARGIIKDTDLAKDPGAIVKDPGGAR